MNLMFKGRISPSSIVNRELKIILNIIDKFDLHDEIINLSILWHTDEKNKLIHPLDRQYPMDVYDFIYSYINTTCDIKLNHVYLDSLDVISQLTFKPTNDLDIMNNVDMFNYKNKRIKNKVCYWTWDPNELSNLDDPKNVHLSQKSTVFSENEWKIFENFITCRYNVVRLSHRDTIEEVFYHLSTCMFSIGHSGAFHSLSAFLNTPQITLCNSKIKPDLTLHQFENIIYDYNVYSINDTFQNILLKSGIK